MANIVGTPGDDTLNGTADADLIEGLGGSDSLYGNGGIDVLDGGDGNDYLTVETASDDVLEDDGEGYDIVFALASYVLRPGRYVESLGAHALTGTNAVDLTGNALDNRIVGNDGVNSLDGGGGTDILYGEGGNDFYIVDGQEDRVIESASEGSDTVFTSVSYVLEAGQHIETLGTLNFLGTQQLDLTGNDLANRLVGNAASSTLFGGGPLAGSPGVIMGGADVLEGGNGNDFYIVNDLYDMIAERVNEGYDIVFATYSYRLSGHPTGGFIESLGAFDLAGTDPINLAGNSHANRIVGNAGSNIINGAGGNDELWGLGGADRFMIEQKGFDNADYVADFDPAEDKFALMESAFPAFPHTTPSSTPQPLNPNAFVIGSAAQDADDRIIYNAVIGSLLYDGDGTGPEAAVQFATVPIGTVLSSTNFEIYGNLYNWAV